MSLNRLYTNFLKKLSPWSSISISSYPNWSMEVAAFLIVGALLSGLLFSECFSANAFVPGKERLGLFYAITHLPMFAYGTLFLIFCLSAINLLLQIIFSRDWPTRLLDLFYPKGVTIHPIRGFPKKPGYRHGSREQGTHKTTTGPRYDGVVAVRTITKDRDQSTLFPPTPLDGSNHRLPKFGPMMDQSSVEAPSLKKDEPKLPPFREIIYSAVDVPSQEELKRREKQRLVVSGSVIGPDGKPLESAVVYLADVDGNKVGQSCRSNDENGFFKVLVNEAGTYLVHAYKQGYAMADDKPKPVPVQSGKVDGLVVKLVSQECLIKGRAILEDGNLPLPDIEIKCVCRSEGFVGTSRTDEGGNFRLPNVPMNSECYLEAIDQSGNILAKTNGFETVQKKQLYKDIRIPLVQSGSDNDSSEVFNPFI